MKPTLYLLLASVIFLAACAAPAPRQPQKNLHNLPCPPSPTRLNPFL